jgi:hypothetical protein
MRLARIADTGGERPAVWDIATRRDLTALTSPAAGQVTGVARAVDGGMATLRPRSFG